MSDVIEDPAAAAAAAAAGAAAAASAADTPGGSPAGVVTAAAAAELAGVPESPPVRVLSYESEAVPRGLGDRWRVGTLVYTTGGLIVLFCWLLFGDFALSMRDRSAGPVATLMLRQFGASDTILALLLASIPPAVSLLLAPIVSYKSDRFRSRWGRRIPFLLVPTPIAVLAMVGMAFCRPLGEELHAVLGRASPGLSGCLIICFGVFWTSFEFAVVTAQAVLGGLIADVVPRPVLGRFFGLFRAVSLIAGILFNSFMLGTAEHHFTAIFVAMAALFGGGFTLMCLMVREGEYPPPEPISDDPRARGFLAAARTYLRECFAHPYYVWVFAAMMLGMLTFIPFNTFSLPYAQALKMNMSVYGKLIGASYFISLLIAYPLGVMVDRVHALRVGIAAMALYTASTFYGAVFVTGPGTFGVALVAHTVLSGTYYTATAPLAQALFPRLKFGQYASAAAMVLAVGQTLVSPIIGRILQVSGHNYRLTFVAGLLLCALTLVSYIVVHQKFMALGGPKRYVAPE